MVHLRGAVIGIIVFLSIVLGAVLALVYLGYAPMAADSAPSRFEANLAMTAVHAMSDREMGERHDPLPVTDATMAAGLTIYQQNCILCHGAADGKPSNVASGFYVPSPQFATDGAEDDREGSTYWKIHHGIRFSAMPAFQHSLTETKIWSVTMFLKHMDKLPAAVDAKWKAVKSVGGMNMAPNSTMDMK